MTAVVWVLVLVVALLAVLVVGLLRSHAVILRALHQAGFNLDPDAEPPSTETAIDLRTVPGVPEPVDVSGQRADDIVGALPSGGVRSVRMKGRQSTLLAFLSSGCATCRDFWDAFEGATESTLGLPDTIRLVIVTKGVEHESVATIERLAPSKLLTVMSSEAWDTYSVPVAPYFSLVDGASGVIVGEGAAKSWQLVQAMLERAIDDADSPLSTAGMSSLSRRQMLLGRDRHAQVDAELEAAGIRPGDPQLYHSSPHQQAATESGGHEHLGDTDAADMDLGQTGAAAAAVNRTSE